MSIDIFDIHTTLWERGFLYYRHNTISQLTIKQISSSKTNLIPTLYHRIGFCQGGSRACTFQDFTRFPSDRPFQGLVVYDNIYCNDIYRLVQILQFCIKEFVICTPISLTDHCPVQGLICAGIARHSYFTKSSVVMELHPLSNETNLCDSVRNRPV